MPFYFFANFLDLGELELLFNTTATAIRRSFSGFITNIANKLSFVFGNGTSVSSIGKTEVSLPTR